MSRPTELADVVGRLDEFGPLATLVTVTHGAAPHVGTVLVTAGETRLLVNVGGRTRGHIQANSAVTLTWIRDGGDYQMIVDGEAVVDDEPDADGLFATAIAARRGILHRLAGRRDGPTCRALRVTAVA